MFSLHIKKNNPKKLIQSIMDVLMERSSLSATAARCNMTQNAFKCLIKDYIPHYQPMRSQITLYKNIDLIYQDFNEGARQLGPKVDLSRYKNIDDVTLSPEYADAYIAFDQRIIDTEQRLTATERIYHKALGVTDATAVGHLVLNDSGGKAGVLLLCNVSISLAKQSFSQIYSYLRSGMAWYFIKESCYQLSIDDGRSITLFPREVECLLYLIVGFSVKEASRFMRASPRTVENLLAKIKEKAGCLTRAGLIDKLIDCHLLQQL